MGAPHATSPGISRVPLGPGPPSSQIWALDFCRRKQGGLGSGVLEMEKHQGEGGIQRGRGSDGLSPRVSSILQTKVLRKQRKKPTRFFVSVRPQTIMQMNTAQNLKEFKWGALRPGRRSLYGGTVMENTPKLYSKERSLSAANDCHDCEVGKGLKQGRIITKFDRFWNIFACFHHIIILFLKDKL